MIGLKGLVQIRLGTHSLQTNVRKNDNFRTKVSEENIKGSELLAVQITANIFLI